MSVNLSKNFEQKFQLKFGDILDDEVKNEAIPAKDATKVRSRTFDCIGRYTSPRSLSGKIKYIAYRIWNAIKAIFGASDWQRARQLLEKSLEKYIIRDLENGFRNMFQIFLFNENMQYQVTSDKINEIIQKASFKELYACRTRNFVECRLATLLATNQFILNNGTEPTEKDLEAIDTFCQSSENKIMEKLYNVSLEECEEIKKGRYSKI